MKQFIIIAFFAFVYTTVSAQDIVHDRTEKGIRTILTAKTNCRSMTDKIVLQVGLSAIIDEQNQDTTLYFDTYLTAGSEIEVRKGSPLLLKLMDGTIMELSAATNSKNPVWNSNVIGGQVFRTYDIFPSYSVTAEQLESICKTGVKKIRIDIIPNMFDKEFKKDKISAALRNYRDALKSAFRKPSANSKEGFREGF